MLDTNLTDELIEEGFVYEVISKIQTMRKDADFEVMDHITVYISGNEKIADIVKKNADAIGEKVLANTFMYEAGGIAAGLKYHPKSLNLGAACEPT